MVGVQGGPKHCRRSMDDRFELTLCVCVCGVCIYIHIDWCIALYIDITYEVHYIYIHTFKQGSVTQTDTLSD